VPAYGDLGRINTNIGALNALNALNRVNTELSLHALRVATGKRINSAGDDPAGLTLSNTLNVRARKIAQAMSNIGDASNVLSIAESGLSNINDILSSMAEKLIQAASDTEGSSERAAILQELNNLGEEIDSITKQTQFNGVVLLTSTTLTFQTGPDGVDFNVFTMTSAFTSASLGISSLTVASQALSSASLGSVNAALTSVKTQLQQLGALLERFQIKAQSLSVAQLNVTAAASRIMDADLASEQLQVSRLQILRSTSTAQLAAANAAPAQILQLFQ
jgi:flagellin